MYRLSDKLYHKPMFNVVLPQDGRVLLREPGLSMSEGKRGWSESGAQRHERAGGVNEESAIYRRVRRKPCQRACVRRPQIKCGVGGSGVWCVNCVSVHVSGIYSLNAVTNRLNTLSPAVNRRNVWTITGFAVTRRPPSLRQDRERGWAKPVASLPRRSSLIPYGVR